MDAVVDTFWKHFETVGTAQVNEAMLTRASDTLWKLATAPDAATSATSGSAGAAAAALLAPTAFSKQIEIGRSMLSDTERWKLQAALRREETKVGGKEYNKKVTRATKTTKGPTPGEAFPPGRGRPVR